MSDISELSFHPRGNNLRDSRSGGYRCAHENRVAAIREQRVGCNGFNRFLDRRAFAGEGCFIRGKRVSLKEMRIGGNDVACFQQQYVAGNNVGSGQQNGSALAKHTSARRRHGSKGQNCALRAVFLEETDEPVQKNDASNRDGVKNLTQRRRYYARANE